MSNLKTPHAVDRRFARHSRWRPTVRVAICASLCCLGLAAFTSSASAIAPVALANPAVQVAGGFSLKGTIYTYELDTHYHFEYGTTTSYDASVPIPDGDAGDAAIVPVSQTVTGLAPNTTYHYRLVANNSDGPGTSGDETFTTSTDPSAPAPPSPAPAPGNQTESKSNQGASGASKKVKVKEAKIKGRTILTASNGHTLYSLSAERNGKFVCTKSSGCLALWHPLMVPGGAKPTGPVKLGVVKRPEGGEQATFHGLPLYSFAQDRSSGQTNGEGLKDVGTWHAVTVSRNGHRSG